MWLFRNDDLAPTGAVAGEMPHRPPGELYKSISDGGRRGLAVSDNVQLISLYLSQAESNLPGLNCIVRVGGQPAARCLRRLGYAHFLVVRSQRRLSVDAVDETVGLKSTRNCWMKLNRAGVWLTTLSLRTAAGDQHRSLPRALRVAHAGYCW